MPISAPGPARRPEPWQRTIEIFFDFGSPTAYVAHTQLPGIAERTGNHKSVTKSVTVYFLFYIIVIYQMVHGFIIERIQQWYTGCRMVAIDPTAGHDGSIDQAHITY